MIDIVKRLRSEIGSYQDMIAMHLEAAYEIERLRKDLERHKRIENASCLVGLDDMREVGKQASEWAALWNFIDFLDAHEDDRE